MENIKDFKSEYSYIIKDKIYTDFVGMDKIKVEIPMVSSITQNYRINVTKNPDTLV